ncbi:MULTISPECIES: hypothetical protein [unclassified Streptomyces]|uniref:hypothetical protein n=1 Tax=unclassified Streptomyces TaxID=2593676 RepID=UPI0034059287
MTDTGLNAAAASLRTWLNAQRFLDLSAHEVTAFLTASIGSWGEGLDYIVCTEVPMPPDAVSPEGRGGMVDLQLRHYSGRGRPISIEIDRGNKRLSLNKLVRLADRGHIALWVRWSHQAVPVQIPPSVRLIRAHVIRRRDIARTYRFSLQTDSCG